MLDPDQITELRTQLLEWFALAKRDLPWRRTCDPYAVWVSEIMLQQTRVAAAIPYYERFLTSFPSVEALAKATEPDLLAHWAGLGYYYRARNLQKAAREIHASGTFPQTFEALRQLPGIGEYTAAAIASIAFDLPHAVVDGNVLRVLSRLCNADTDIGTLSGKRRFQQIADNLLDRVQPGTFNQALMELGATVCLPKAPQCLTCPVSSVCEGRREGTADRLPVKTTDRRKIEIERTLFWIERDSQLLLWQRPASSRLMPGFWELPEAEQLANISEQRTVGAFSHSITVHRFRFRVVEATEPEDIGSCEWVERDRLQSLPLSTIARKAFRIVKDRKKALAAAT